MKILLNTKFRNLFLVLLIFSACNFGKNKKNANQDKGKGPVSIDVSIAHKQSFTNMVEANGSILALESVQLRPEMSGRIVFLNIPDGKTVVEGTLLMKLYDDDLKAQLKKLNSQLSIAKKTEVRLKSLLLLNGLNQQEYDLALTQMQNIEADIDYTNALIRKTEVRAPFTGIIGLRRVSIGAFINPQDVLATLQETSALKVDFVLPEAYANRIGNGDLVEVLDDKLQTFNAKVIGIEPLVNSNTRNIQVRAMVQGSKGALRPGAFVRVQIDVAKNKEGILVPTNCIIPETRFKKIAVIKNGTVDMRNVETGYRGESFVEITSGLNLGDTFAVSGILFLKPKAEVLVKSVKP
jgi:membrane fusion protein (multidrug efflux system)